MPVAAPVIKPYLYDEELAALTPWSRDEIDAKIKRGVLRLGVHYFQQRRRARRIFKWAAIVELIEGGTGNGETASGGIHVNGKGLDVEKATAGLYRLLDR
jgi:hypothetical protein